MLDKRLDPKADASDDHSGGAGAWIGHLESAGFIRKEPASEVQLDVGVRQRLARFVLNESAQDTSGGIWFGWRHIRGAEREVPR